MKGRQLLDPLAPAFEATLPNQSTIVFPVNSDFNEVGLALWKQVTQRVERGEFKLVIERWTAVPIEKTGDVRIFGMPENRPDQEIHTGVCLFLTPSWCYTLSGSLYRLK